MDIRASICSRMESPIKSVEQKNLMYGKKRLLRQIKSSSSVAEAIEGIMADLASYQSHHKRRDDLTLFGFSFR